MIDIIHFRYKLKTKFEVKKLSLSVNCSEQNMPKSLVILQNILDGYSHWNKDLQLFKSTYYKTQLPCHISIFSMKMFSLNKTNYAGISLETVAIFSEFSLVNV